MAPSDILLFCRSNDQALHPLVLCHPQPRALGHSSEHFLDLQNDLTSWTWVGRGVGGGVWVGDGVGDGDGDGVGAGVGDGDGGAGSVLNRWYSLKQARNMLHMRSFSNRKLELISQVASSVKESCWYFTFGAEIPSKV